MIRRLPIAIASSLAGVATVAGIGLALSAPAAADPLCDPSNRNFSQDACSLEPQNDASCNIWGLGYDPNKCLSDQFVLGTDEAEEK